MLTTDKTDRHSRVGKDTASAAEIAGGDMQAREFSWTQADFARVQSLIYQRAGISLHDGKHAMVYSRLSRRLRETGYQSFRDYLSWLESHDGPEWQEFVNALTTNLTSFFREQHHFEILAEHLKSRPASTPWRVWCNAASTGEEPYSILMTAMEALGSQANFRCWRRRRAVSIARIPSRASTWRACNASFCAARATTKAFCA